MSSVNKAIIVGRLGRDPEIRYMPSGDAIANIAVATSYKSKDKVTGESKEISEWHRVSFFGKLAEIVGQYLTKGAMVYVEGRLQTRKYQKDGVDHYTTEIVGEQMRMLGGGQQNGDGQQTQQQDRRQAPPAPAPSPREQARDRQHAASNQHQPQARPAPNFSDMDDDISFLFSNINIRTATESRQLKRAQQGRVSSVEF